MGFEIVISLLLIASYHLQYGDGRMALNIKDFLSDSNNTNVDHSQAFQEAWKALCGAKGEASSLVINAHETYTIRPQLFQGPCASRNLHIQINGIIEAPISGREWKSQKGEAWLSFQSVTGLVLSGSGLLHSHGEIWWFSVALSSRPHAVRFSGCNDIVYNGLTQRNSPKNHISITSCINATLSNLHLIAPANSPNTDGIDISESHNIHILGSKIETGDDCVAINGGSYDINITSVTCGPGHGISIGSLGGGGAIDTVQNVNVRYCTFKGTQNGARIKTWAGGQGFAHNILYEHITLIAAKFPINIDQQYDGRDTPKLRTNGVKVRDVTFRDFRGTCADGVAINIDCDRRVGCDNIVMEYINITSSSPQTPVTAYCRFAKVISRFISVDVKCDFREDNQPYHHPPALYAQPPAPLAQPPMLLPFLYLL